MPTKIGLPLALEASMLILAYRPEPKSQPGTPVSRSSFSEVIAYDELSKRCGSVVKKPSLLVWSFCAQTSAAPPASSDSAKRTAIAPKTTITIRATRLPVTRRS